MSDEALHNERRQFSRILFNAECTLGQGDIIWTTDVLDISLKGLLLNKPAGFAKGSDPDFDATIKLAGDQQQIRMHLKYSHENNNALGFECHHIDLDSMTHLKRLVELNVGDEGILQRELSALSSH